MTAFTFIHGDTTQWMAVLIDAAAKGLVVLLLAAGATLLLRRSSAAVRHMTWTVSVAALILVPFLSLALPQLQVPLLPDWAGTGGLARMEQTAAQSPAVVELRVGTGGPGAESVMPAGDWPSPAGAPQPVHPADASPETPAAPVLAAAAPQTPPVHWSAWVLLAWLAGAAALLLPLLAGTVIVWRQARRAERINSGSWVHLLDELRQQLGVRGRVVLLRSNWPNIPLTCGIFRPAIILPAEADDWPADRRRVVLLHELAHIRRRDCLTQLLARLTRVIYWFNPLVWLAGRMLRIEREQACDDLVLASGHKASDYAGHLLEIVRSLHSVRCPSLAAVAMARKSQFEGRLLAILDPRRNRRSLTRWGVVVAAVLVAAVAVPLAVLKATGPEKPAVTQPATHPAIGIYIVTDHPKGIPFEKTPLADFTLAAEPLVSEADIFTYDWGTHTIRLRQAVADRVLNQKRSGGHFVVVVDGQRLYRGAMVSGLTSIVPLVPMINVGLTAEQWQPKFAIRIYPPPGDAPDPRSDDRLKRALLALNKLSNTVDRSPAAQPAAPDEKTKPFPYKLHHNPDEVAATINKIFGNGAATRPAPEATSTQPAGSKLEFRIAPTASSLTNAERGSYMDWLRAGKVGFWWKGGRIAGIAGRMPDHVWLPFAGDMATAGNLVTGEYKGQKYVLVSDKPAQTMVSGEGKEAWGLAKAYATTDAMNLPAVGFEMDDRGAELFSAFTKANINKVLAIVVDGKVISVPVIRAAIGKQGTIPGQFSEQEVNALVQALKAGMPAATDVPAITQVVFPDDPNSQTANSMSCVINPVGQPWLQLSCFLVDEHSGKVAYQGDLVRTNQANQGEVPLVLANTVHAVKDRVVCDFRLMKQSDPVPALMSGRRDDAGSKQGVPEIAFNRQLRKLDSEYRVLWTVRYRMADKVLATYVCAVRAARDEKNVPLRPTERDLTQVRAALNATQPADGQAGKVLEGVGYDKLKVGMAIQEVLDLLGPPDKRVDPDKAHIWLQYRQSRGLDVFFINGKVLEIRFNEGFKPKLSRGPGIGTPLKEVLKTYGQPIRTVVTDLEKFGDYGDRVLCKSDSLLGLGGSSKVEYTTKGVLFGFDTEGKVKQFVVFAPYGEPATRPAIQPAQANWGKAVDGLEVSIIVEGKVFDADRPIPIRWAIRNAGTEDRAIIWHEKQFSPVRFDITDASGKVYPNRIDETTPDRLPSVAKEVILKPGEVKEATYDLDRFLRTRTGELKLVGVYSPPKEFISEKPVSERAARNQIASAPVALTVYRGRAGGRFEMNKDIPAATEVWHKAMPPAQPKPFKVAAATTLRFEDHQGLLVGKLKVGYALSPKDTFLARLELRDKEGKLLAADDASFTNVPTLEDIIKGAAKSSTSVGAANRPESTLQFDLGRAGDLANAASFLLTLSRAEADAEPAPSASSQPAKESPLAGLKIRLVLADKRKEYRIGETVKFNVLAENTGKQAVEFSLTRYPPVAYSNRTEGGLIRLHDFSFYCGGETPDEKFVIQPGRSELLDTEEYILMPPDWRGNTKGRPGVIGVKPQKYSVSYQLSPNYAGQVRAEVLHSEPLVAIDVLPGDLERIRQLTAKYPSGREVAEKFALEFLAAVRKGDAETMNRMIQIHPNFGPKNRSNGVSSAADSAEQMKQSQQWWQELARQIRAAYADHEDLLGRLSETYCMPEDSPRPGFVCVRIAGPANPRDGSLWVELACWSNGWRVKNAGFGDPKTSLKQLLIDLMAAGAKAASGEPTTQPAEPAAVADIAFPNDPDSQTEDTVSCVINPVGRPWLQVSTFMIDESSGTATYKGDITRTNQFEEPVVMTSKVRAAEGRVVCDWRLRKKSDPMSALMSTRRDDNGSNAGLPEIGFNRQLRRLDNEYRILWTVRYRLAGNVVATYVCAARAAHDEAVVPIRPAEKDLKQLRDAITALHPAQMPTDQRANMRRIDTAKADIERLIKQVGRKT